MIGGKDFKTSIGKGEQAQGEVMEGGTEASHLLRRILCVFFGRRRRKMSV